MNIGFDLDNVLANHMSALVTYYNNRYGTALTRNSFRSLKFWETWGGTREEAIEIVHGFYASPEFAAIVPVDGAEEGVERIKPYHRLDIITSRPTEIIPATSDWLNKYFPDKFAGVYFGNEYAKNRRPSTSKHRLCEFLDIDVMVEDSLEHALECVDEKRPIILLDNPWNRSQELPKDVYRAASWKEVAQLLKDLTLIT